MTNELKGSIVAAVTIAVLCFTTGVRAQQANMTFFITSAGPGKGADLGGLEGADAHCAKLAKAAGSSLTSWKAYLSKSPRIDRSVQPARVIPGVNARDRVGSGPWQNAKGVVVAKNVDDLHSPEVKINKETGLDENGNKVNARGDKPNKHDILTGSDPRGMYSTAGGDTTCGNWAKSGDGGSAIVGHHDRAGLSKDWHMLSWNSAHGTAGCSEEKLPRTGGAGLFYCFHAD